MKVSYGAVMAACIFAFCAACGTGEFVAPPTDSTITVVDAGGGNLRVAAGPLSADPGSNVSLVAPATGSGVAARDGSFSFDGTTVGAGNVTVFYTKQDVTLQTAVTPVTLESRIDNSPFPTGAAPNDLLLMDNVLFVANSLDNTVTRYSLDGQLSGSASFPQFASPSYLVDGDGAVYVARNGDNILTGLDSDTLLPLVPAFEVEFSDPLDATFLGPGKGAMVGAQLVFPFAGITDPGPTTDYSATAADVISPTTAAVFETLELEGVNGQQAISSADGETFYVVTAGSLQFDENFSPFVTSDSFLEEFDADTTGSATRSLNLGEIGASGMAISADGKTGYINSLLSGNLYKVDLETMTVLRGEDDPIVLTDEFTYISDLELQIGTTLLFATSFNTDELIVVDTATDTVNPGIYHAPFDLSLDGQFLAGCQSLEIGPRPGGGGMSAYVLYAVANSVTRVDLF